MEKVSFADDKWSQYHDLALYQRCTADCQKQTEPNAGKDRSWTAEEKDAAIECMAAVLDEQQDLSNVWKWAVVSDRLRSDYGIEKSRTAVRSWWAREGRDLSQIDERKRKNPHMMVTSKNDEVKRRGDRLRKRQEREESE